MNLDIAIKKLTLKTSSVLDCTSFYNNLIKIDINCGIFLIK